MKADAADRPAGSATHATPGAHSMHGTSGMYPTLGIDFGTSNSAAAWGTAPGVVQPLALEGSAGSLPTAIFYNSEERRTHFGRDAIAHYLAGTEGRLMRSLKSLLGSALLLEKTEVFGQAISFRDIIATFLKEIRRRSEQQAGAAHQRVVLGRPVHFVDDDPRRDALAQQMLLEAAQAAGLRNVSFMFEPIAAAFDHERRITRENLVLVADIGGGTSDFSVVRLGPIRARRALAGADRAHDILAAAGVHVAGTDFDHKLSLEAVMPLLGFRHLGPRRREVPSGVFFDLATWHLIQWRYSAKALHEARELRADYADPRLHGRLMTVLQHRLGHHLANDVEQAKIDSSQTGQDAVIDLRYVEAGLRAGLDAAGMAMQLQPLLQRVVGCALDCVRQAGLAPQDLDAIYLTGGSSAFAPFRETLRSAFTGTAIVEGDLFGGVAAGLALGGAS